MVIGERFEIDMALDKLKAASEYVKSIIIMKFNKKLTRLSSGEFFILSTHS